MKSALCTIGFDIKYLVANPWIYKRSDLFMYDFVLYSDIPVPIFSQ